MKTKLEYPGIDYSRGASNCDSENGIRYGVISQNSVMPEALDDIMTHGKDLAWEEALKEAISESKSYAEKAGNDPDEIDEDAISDRLSNHWESSFSNYLYEQDGYKLTGCLDNDLFVMKSRYYTHAQFCSPCVPGAGNLDNPFVTVAETQNNDAANMGFPKVYCLGHDWFEGGKAPYRVFSVETGMEIKAEKA